ncbi:hypothetical protein [Hyalangium minutum]|uniref:hypothetical protein n=1 Tax=Hyalangium minutum TaxID=394096 RepID=UPI0006948065|nr:hypothetical protein [Hyalangium minutum]
MSPDARWGGLGWLFVALLASGCASNHITVHVKPSAGTNQGRPMYMVVRTVDSKKYLSETYTDVVAKVVTPDDSVLETSVVYPGAEKSLKIKVPEESAVAVSFLFTAPDGAWQALVDAPLPGSVNFELLESRIKTSANTGAKPVAKVDTKAAKDVKLDDLEKKAGLGKKDKE